MSKKLLLLMGLLLIAMMSNLIASESRLVSLGNTEGFIRDNTDVYKYPGTIYKYVKNANVELTGQGNQTNWNIGVNLPLNQFVLGVYLNRPTDINLNNYLYHSDYGFNNLDISKKIQFLLGFGNGLAAGFGMAFDSKTDPEPSDVKKNIVMSAMYFEFNGGMSNEKMDLGAFLKMPIAGIENEVSKEEDGLAGIGLGVNGRYFISEGPKLTTMALGNLEISSIAEERKTGAIKRKHTDGHFLLDMGLGANYNVDANNCLILGVYPLRIDSYSWTNPNSADPKKEDAFSTGYVYLPKYKVAFESRIASWLTGRVGVCQDFFFYSYSEKYNGQPEEVNGFYASSFDAQLGFGMNFKRFTIDGVLTDALLFDGPDFIGGTGPGMSSKLSIGYDFN